MLKAGVPTRKKNGRFFTTPTPLHSHPTQGPVPGEESARCCHVTILQQEGSACCVLFSKECHFCTQSRSSP